ncbi:MAG: PilZ domain-containing protein [Deltaproteobacteria bacterium]|nr:PilZ domain-containing protein [Deltaproteobacteria bacterium]
MVDVHALSTAASPSSGETLTASAASVAGAEKRLPPRILLVARPGDACTLYEAAIRNMGATVDTVASIDTFYGAVTHFAYNGVVIDIPTKIKALSDHKALVYSIMGRFPVIQVNLDRRSGAIRALLYGHHERSGLLEDLIREACWGSPARKLRSEERKPLHYNVLLSTTREFDPRTLIRTVTMDVSSNGCFLFTSARFQLGGRVWLRIVDLYDKSPISGIVRHKRKWGEAMVVPGIGIKFETITESQRQALLNPVSQPSLETVPGDDLRKGAK